MTSTWKIFWVVAIAGGLCTSCGGGGGGGGAGGDPPAPPQWSVALQGISPPSGATVNPSSMTLNLSGAYTALSWSRTLYVTLNVFVIDQGTGQKTSGVLLADTISAESAGPFSFSLSQEDLAADVAPDTLTGPVEIYVSVDGVDGNGEWQELAVSPSLFYPVQ